MSTEMPTRAYTRNVETQGGSAVFAGTRVNVWILFNYLASGRTVDDFLRAYDRVPRQAVLDVLDEASRALVGQNSRGE
jgi:uncharacterized protein (DUF433 family)